MRTAGLDLGLTRAAFVRLARDRGGEVRLEAAAIVPLEAGLDEGSRAVEVARALGAAGRAEASLGLPGRDAILRYIQLPPVPPWRLKLLMSFEVEDVAAKAGEALAADYRALAIPADIAGAEGTQVLVGLAKEAALLSRIEALAAAGLKTRAVVPGSVALFDACVGLGRAEAGKTVILVDAGPDSCELAIARDRRLVFARGLPAGTDQALATFGAREAQALASAVAASVQFCRTQQSLSALPLDRVLVSGTFGRSPELIEALGRTLKVEVATFDPLEDMRADGLGAEARAAIARRGPELVIAVGLALAAAHPDAIDLDLTPRPIRERREFARRTVFLYAALAFLAVALAITGATAAAARSSALARRADLSKVLTALETRRDALDAEAERNRREIQVVSALGERTQAGAAALRLIARLRAATPARVTVSEIALDPPGREAAARAVGGAGGAGAAAPPGETGFKLKGAVDNAGGDAIELLGRFEAALREDPAIALAKVTGTPVLTPEALLEFAMAVRLRAAAPAAAGDE